MTTQTQTKQPLFVEFKGFAIIEDMPVEDLLYFDMLLMDNITVTTAHGEKLTGELDSLTLRSIVSFDDEDNELVHLDILPKYEYRLVDSKVFRACDTVLIEYDEFVVVKLPSDEVMLYNYDNNKWLGWGCGTVEELNEQLKLQVPDYQVLRKIEVR